MKKMISVIGGAECSEDEASFAEEVGRQIANLDYGVVCGGRSGVMEAACRGVYLAGGLTIGILPTVDLKQANPYLTVALPTGLGQARNVLVVLAGDVVLAIGGGFGTLSEIGQALKHGKPVLGYRTWEAKHDNSVELPILRVQSPDQAIETIQSLMESL